MVTETFLSVPTSINFIQYTNVQRGTIFMWFFSIFVITIVVGIRVISGQIEVGRSVYQDNPPPSSGPAASMENFSHVVAKAQVPTEDDTGSIKMMKLVDKFNTVLMPVLITFALNLILGASFAFSLILYFIVLVPIVLFNLAGLHTRFFEHRAFICIFQNLWLIGSFFWLLNIWVTVKYIQPYSMYQIKY